MRLLVPVLLVVALSACQRAESARSEPEAAPAAAQTTRVAASTVAPDPVPLAGEGMPSCGCGGGGGSCGSCNGSCMGAVAEAPSATAPADAVWTELSVAGMRCGGCARKIQSALAQVEGIQAVEVDHTTGSVRVATAAGTDARALAAPRIDALGYHVN